MFSLFNQSVDPVERSAEAQAKVDAQTQNLKLYKYDSCPFCRRVSGHIDALALNIEVKNIQLDPQNRQDLIAGGGKGQVPALRIQGKDGSVQWMYESGDIVDYLSHNFAA